MRIFFNNTIFFLQRYGGISRYIVCLAEQLIQDKFDVKIIAPIFKNRYLNQISRKNLNGIYIKRFPPLKIFEIYSDLIFKNNIKKWQPNIVHDTYYSNNLSFCKNSAKIVTIHDLIHEKFSKLYATDKKLIKSKILKYADHFICVSKNTQKDLINYYNIPKNKTSVIYHGADHLNKKKLQYNNKLFSKPFVLFVGSRTKYKNFEIIPKSFSLSKKVKDNVNIVCFGGNKFAHDEKKRFRELQFNENQIIQIDGNDNLLENLYSQAMALIFPSIYEGFGFPLLEAMKMGCPVIASKKSVMSEICGNAAKYFDPLSSDELIGVIEKILYSDETKVSLINKGFLNVSNFTWKNCAKNTLKVYNKF
jgi:glycosyltransferase involved in cell wall biosynthesis|tara:strand:- start:249 stop:1334 length:1086 start_codon:yes stop_codon:yes gene_type:complete